MSRRQWIVGLLLLPLSVIPFLAYGWHTPEGRLLRDRAIVAVSPPSIPDVERVESERYRSLTRGWTSGVVVLAYHGLGSSGDGASGALDASAFAEHLAALDAIGAVTVTATDVADAMAGRGPLPANAVMLTFDDGRRDSFLWADPLLEDAGMRATMFVIADAAEDPGTYYASWRELRSRQESGRWDLQAHTAGQHRAHETAAGELPALTSRADGETLRDWRRRVEADLERADDSFDRELGQRPVAFAYPFGASGTDDRTNDRAIASQLRRALGSRYLMAFHQDGQQTAGHVDLDDPELDLRRLSVADWSGADLIRRIERAVRAGDAAR